MNKQPGTDGSVAAVDQRISRAPQGWNLLRVKPLKTLVLWPGFPYVIQAAVLVLFLYLAVLGWGRLTPAGVPDKLYAKTNLVNLLIWGLWWPAMVWTAVWFGRVWCAICPLELVANATERLGRLLGVPQRKAGRWLRSGALILALYFLIQLLVAGVHLHRVPAYTSLFLWAMLATAALVGFLYQDRAFCRGFCPVGLLLGTYGRGSMLAVRRVSAEACEACEDHACSRACHRTKLDARSCPSLLNPAMLRSNTDCLVCGQCIKVCQPQDNMGLYLRRPFHPSDSRESLASWPVTLFVMLVSGFVSYELCSEWTPARSVFLWVPSAVTSWLGLDAYQGWIVGLWRLLVAPAAIWLLLGATVLLLGGAKSIGQAWRRLALPLAVVVSAGHMAKGLAKIASWGGYLPLALSEPGGSEHAQRIADGLLATPAHLLPMPAVSLAAVALIALMIGFALRESRLADPQTHASRIPAILLWGLTALAVTAGWGLGG